MTQAFYSSEAGRFTSTVARLFGTDGPPSGVSYPLMGEESTVGRGRDSAVCLQSPGVSKTHCTILREAGRYVIVDEGSRNGTEVNGRTLKPGTRLQLAHGDCIRICEASFFFLDPSNTAEAGAVEKIQIDFGAASREASAAVAGFAELTALRKGKRSSGA